MLYDIVKSALQQKAEAILLSNRYRLNKKAIPTNVGEIMDNKLNIADEICQFADDAIIGRIQKTAQNLALAGQNDMADYLSLVVKIASDGQIKNAKITAEYVMKNLVNGDIDKLVFEKTYKAECARAKTFGAENIEKAALLSTMQKMGIKLG